MDVHGVHLGSAFNAGPISQPGTTSQLTSQCSSYTWDQLLEPRSSSGGNGLLNRAAPYVLIPSGPSCEGRGRRARSPPPPMMAGGLRARPVRGSGEAA